jgi:hypothetical protein
MDAQSYNAALADLRTVRVRFPRCARGTDQLVRAGCRVFRFVGSAVACLV